VCSHVASTVIQADWKTQKLAFPIQYPAVLGLDSAGIVEEVGEGVTGWKKGDRV
jgi:NADPH:quinone reductase-like Zn-dependent oxidoreductase